MKIRGIRPSFPALLILLVLATLASPAPAAMNDYCAVPPYVIQNIAPNVMLVADISGSMYNFAYYDGYLTPDPSDDHDCSAADPCTEFDSSKAYYGYFDSRYWYTYSGSGNKFVRSRLKSTGSTNAGSEWDGSFLNWLTMRRVDVLRKVLTGGKKGTGESTGFDRIMAEVADCDSRGTTKSVVANNLTPFTGSKTFTVSSANGGCGGGGSGTSEFTVSGESGTYKIQVVVPAPVQGVLQEVVGARARIGLTFYNANTGGNVRVNVGGGSLSSTVNEINVTRPTTNTPLAETLWTITGYFAQDDSMESGPGPRYGNSDFSISKSADPLNYDTGQGRWPVCSKSFVLYITDGEPCSDGYLPSTISDYASGKSDYNCNGSSCPSVAKTTGSFAASTLPVCPAGGNVAGIEDVALYMHTTDLRSDIANTQNLTLYTVFAFGKGSTLLRYAAINGGFVDNGSHVPSPQSSWDGNNDGEPDTFFEATDGAELEQAIRDAFSSILKRASSGTAASVLASGEGSGANLIQAVFYPRRAIGNDVIWWTGALQNMWYYVDPFFTNASIYEDTAADNVLNLSNDYIAQFYYDSATELTQVRRWSSDANGHAVAQQSTLSFENISSLWEAGKKLWARDLSSSPRHIKTSLDGTTLIDFSTANASTLSPYLQETGDNVVTTINYINGIDNTDDMALRSRTVAFVNDNAVWKLGDVINSTPRIVAGVALNKYDTTYFDTTYKSFIDNTTYKNRGMVFTGGNDGMLHAFLLGKLELSWTGKTSAQKARVSNPNTEPPKLGDEAWAFIPKNSLPYLKYLKDPDYCHIYYTDLAPYVFDASIGGNPTDKRTASSWRTVVIGGMRTGGACDNTAGCTSANNCVKTPGGGAVGFSSYFALDVTDPTNPDLLWEFTNPHLGFTTTGPAIVRVNALNSLTLDPDDRDRSLNGEWYVVFGSGPTGPIDNTNNQFLGRSNQDLRFFIVDLKTGTLKQTIETGIPYAFAGSMINSVADFELDYQDDAVYAGYVKKVGSTSTWTDGGVGRILTKNITPSDSGGWAFSKVIDGIGPVTSAVVRLQSRNLSTNWLFFGTGRYFFEIPASGNSTTPDVDDGYDQRKLFGVKEPCFTANNTINSGCTTTVSFSTADPGFPNVTSISDVPTESVANSGALKGWYIDLEDDGTYTYDNVSRLFRTERVITDPLSTTSGVVYFTTYKPYGDECALGGKSFLWAVRYNTGGTPSTGVLKGKALVQVSTASVEQLDLSTAFQGDASLHKGGRRTGAIEGVPPTSQGLSLLTAPPPTKRILHMIER